MRWHRGLLASLLPLALLVVRPASGQQPPGTDIFLAELMVRGGVLVVGQPARVTDRDGYDNQPSFAPDGGSLLYTSIREDGQADIYRYDIASGLTSRVTQTAESEYSATSLPDGSGISVVRVEADSTQRLWRFGWEGGKPELLLSAVRPVGYHAWADEFTLGLFVLGTPATLQLADLRTGEAEIVVEGIGRSLHRVPGRRAISFLRRDGEGDRWIEEIDVANRAIRRLVQPRGRGEDYAWTPDGRIVMAEGSKLFIWDPAKGGEWQELADLAGTGIREVTRLAISAAGDRLALVAAR